jgi:viologen exporter family transport system permease protein
MFPTMLRIGFADLLAYRAQVVIWILTTTMPLIMYALWSTVAREAPLGRFDESTFAAYFLSTLVVRQLSSSWVVWELNEHIRTGALSTTLLRPVHPLWFYAAENLGAVPFRLVVMIPLIVVAFLVLPEMRLATTPLNLLLYLWTISVSWALTFGMQSMIALLAFYTQQSLSFQDAWFGLWAILSGYLIPLELMPKVAALARWLPFRAMGSLPTEIILGHLEGRDLLQGVAVQAGWAIVFLLVIRWAWRKALARFEAYGG